MDQKTQRYMQRIDKIMYTPRKSTNPARPSKSPLINQPKNLDIYLKYELSSKIVQGVITRNHQRLVNQFFTAIRSNQVRQKEKVYKFVAVQKSDKVKEIQIDFTISGKILGATLKGLVRMRYIDFINSLQTFWRQANNETKTPVSKNKLVRAISERQTQNKETRMRTPTARGRLTSVAVTQWVDKNMVEAEEASDKQQKDKEKEKMKQVAVRFIVKVLKTKVQGNSVWGISNIEATANRKQKTQQIAYAAVAPQMESSTTNQKIYNYVRSIHIVSNISKRRLFSFLSKLKYINHYQHFRHFTSKTFLIKLSSFLFKHNFKQSHIFFSSLRSILSSQKQQSSFLVRSKSNISNSPISHISQISQVQPFNPLAKLNFYAFVDKIFKFIIIISKLLIPVKEAFNRIDHYASFAYKLEEALKTAPRHYLLQAFSEVKEYARNRPQSYVDPTLQNISLPLYDSLSTSIKERLIEGFTHIKIMSKERDLKIKIFPAKQNIVQTTRLFIQERESYTSQSHEHWSGLKSLLIQPKNRTHSGYVRRASHEI